MDKTSQEKLINEVRRYMQNLPLDTHRINVPSVPKTVWEDIAQQLETDARTSAKTWKSKSKKERQHLPAKQSVYPG